MCTLYKWFLFRLPSTWVHRACKQYNYKLFRNSLFNTLSIMTWPIDDCLSSIDCWHPIKWRSFSHTRNIHRRRVAYLYLESNSMANNNNPKTMYFSFCVGARYSRRMNEMKKKKKIQLPVTHCRMFPGYDDVDRFDMHIAYARIYLKKKIIKKHINLVPAVPVHSTERIFLFVTFRSYRSLTYWWWLFMAYRLSC